MNILSAVQKKGIVHEQSESKRVDGKDGRMVVMTKRKQRFNYNHPYNHAIHLKNKHFNEC